MERARAKAERRPRYSRDEYRTIKPTRGESEACLQISRLEVGQLLENLVRTEAGGKEIEHVTYANAHAPNAGTSSALFRVHGDSISDLVHENKYTSAVWFDLTAGRRTDSSPRPR